MDVSVVDVSTTINCTTSLPSAETSVPVLTSVSQTDSEAAESPDMSLPAEPPSMFSTSMAPPRPTPMGQEEELITTVAPTIREAHEDADDVTDINIDDFLSENDNNGTFVPQRGDTFPESQRTMESTSPIDSTSRPVKEPDDHTVIEINTIQPDVPMPDASHITESMFAVGKTEEAILEFGIATGIDSDLTETPTESAEVTSEETIGFSESASSDAVLQSTTPFPYYDFNVDEIETDYAVEALPSAHPSHQDLSSSFSDTTIDVTTVIPTGTTFMCNTHPGHEEEVTTSGPSLTTHTEMDAETPAVGDAVSATAVPIDWGMSAEDTTLSTGVHVFDESAIQFPEHSGETLPEEDTAAEIGTDFFTSSSVTLPAAPVTTHPDEQPVPVTAVMDTQNVSGKT